MNDIILHHYPFSTFSEKVRITLGVKQLASRSAEIAGMPPRPLLNPMTGGYRRAPVMQVGADIYCDTNIILPALERLKPTPPFIPVPVWAWPMVLALHGSARCGFPPLVCWFTLSVNTFLPNSSKTARKATWGSISRKRPWHPASCSTWSLCGPRSMAWSGGVPATVPAGRPAQRG